MKLTLSIDNAVIEAAKAYASAHKKSLSELTEQFYKDMVAKDEAMTFILSLRKQKPTPDFDHRKAKAELVYKKYK